MSGLLALARVCDLINERVGRAVAWVTVAMVLVQFVVVVMRYVFGVGSLYTQQSVVYMHGVIFMVAAGYALLDDVHVRIDIFYAKLPPRVRAYINLIGSLGMLLPLCIVILVQSWPYVVASWGALEGAPEGTGLPGLFLLKTVILVYAGLLAVQGFSLAVRSLAVILGIPSDDGRRS